MYTLIYTILAIALIIISGNDANIVIPAMLGMIFVALGVTIDKLNKIIEK